MSAYLLFSKRDFEIHQFVPFRVVHSSNVEPRTREGSGNIFDVEKEKSRLRRMRFDGSRRELCRLDFIPIFFTHPSLRFFLRNRKRDWMSVCLRITQATNKIIEAGWSQLISAAGNQSDLNVADGNGLIAIVGNNKKNRQVSVILEIDGENLRLLPRIVRVGGDRNLFIGVIVMRSVCFCRLCNRFYKIFTGERNLGRKNKTDNRHRFEKADRIGSQHVSDYRGKLAAALRV